jgi:preprotein translocase subunit YajC
VLVSLGSVAVLAASSSKKSSSGSGYVSFLFLILIVGAVVLMMRRGRNRQKAVIDARQNVAPGVEVVTTAGLIATVIDGDDETVTLEIAPGVQSKFLRQAIARVVVPPSPEATETDAPETTDAPEDNPPEGTH